MPDQLEKAFKAVRKYAESIGETYIEVSVVQPTKWDGTVLPRVLKSYIPKCGYQEGGNIVELIENLDKERQKSPPKKEETPDNFDDLIF